MGGRVILATLFPHVCFRGGRLWCKGVNSRGWIGGQYCWPRSSPLGWGPSWVGRLLLCSLWLVCVSEGTGREERRQAVDPGGASLHEAGWLQRHRAWGPWSPPLPQPHPLLIPSLQPSSPPRPSPPPVPQASAAPTRPSSPAFSLVPSSFSCPPLPPTVPQASASPTRPSSAPSAGSTAARWR